MGRWLTPQIQPWRQLARYPRLSRCSSSVTTPSIAALLRRGSTPAVLEDGATIRIHGFVRSARKQKRIAFAAVGDGSSLEPVQVVMNPEQAEGLSTGTAVSVTGKWQRSVPGAKQSHELHADEIRVLGQHDAETYPLQKKYHSPEYLRTFPHLRARLPVNQLLLRLRSQVISDTTAFFSEHGYIQTHTPVITSSDCEGGGEVFTVKPYQRRLEPQDSSAVSVDKDAGDFFGAAKYLTVSAQLHLEALAQSVGRVWTLSPTFRAEKSDTPRHLSEFYMLEAELSFTDSLNDVMDIVEQLLRSVAGKLQSSALGNELLRARSSTGAQNTPDIGTDADALRSRWTGLTQPTWPRITYNDAVKHLTEAVAAGTAEFEHVVTHEDGLQAEHEKYLATHVGQGSPVFVTDYPRSQKAFYMSPSPQSNSLGPLPTVSCFDLLVPDICELAGGSLREHRLSDLIESMRRHDLHAEPDTSAEAPADSSSSQGTNVARDALNSSEVTANGLAWYMDLRKYGSVPHGGFGLGFDRLLAYLSGTQNVQDVVTFPRRYGRCDC